MVHQLSVSPVHCVINKLIVHTIAQTIKLNNVIFMLYEVLYWGKDKKNSYKVLFCSK